MTPLHGVLVRPDPPLHPSPDDARSLLRRELLHPEYQERDLLGRIMRWADRTLDRALQAASDVPALPALTAMAIGLLLVLGLVVLLSRVRTSARRPSRPGPVLAGDQPGADELRRRAVRALGEGRAGDALVDAFRALARRHIERGLLDDVPGATAHEVAAVLAGVHPDDSAAIEQAAGLFDLVLYGDRPASADQADLVLGLDDRLAGVR